MTLLVDKTWLLHALKGLALEPDLQQNGALLRQDFNVYVVSFPHPPCSRLLHQFRVHSSQLTSFSLDLHSLWPHLHSNLRGNNQSMYAELYFVNTFGG